MLGRCEVCGKDGHVGVACSALGAVSFAYCWSCAASGAEPYGVLVAVAASAGGELAEWVQPIIDATLAVAGKTREQFQTDVANA